MNIGSIQPTQPTVTAVSPALAAAEISTVSGVNSTRVEAPPKQQTDNSPQDQNSANTPQQRATIAQQTTAYSENKGYIFQPGVAGVIYQVKDDAGKVVDQTPSKQRLTQMAYEQKAAQAALNHSADRLA